MSWVSSSTTIGTDTSASTGTSVVGSGTANTKGSYVQFSASLGNDIWGFVFQSVYGASNTLTDDFLFDVSTGAGGAEVVLVSNILQSVQSNRYGIINLFFPVAIASGTRVAIRCQNSSTSTADILRISLILLNKDTQSGSTACQTYGANTSDSGGVAVDPGGVGNTKGSYSELTSSSSADLNWLVILWGTHDGAGAAVSGNWIFDISTGAAASEVVQIADITLGQSSTLGYPQVRELSIPCVTITSGTRISARSAASLTNATARVLDVVIYGFNVPQITGGGGTKSYIG